MKPGVCSQCCEPTMVEEVAGDLMCLECKTKYEDARDEAADEQRMLDEEND